VAGEINFGFFYGKNEKRGKKSYRRKTGLNSALQEPSFYEHFPDRSGEFKQESLIRKRTGTKRYGKTKKRA